MASNDVMGSILRAFIAGRQLKQQRERLGREEQQFQQLTKLRDLQITSQAPRRVKETS
jgi:hypothetical protein